MGRVVVREDKLAQGSEINELQSIGERRGRRVGNLVAKDGDRVEGAEIFVTPEDLPSLSSALSLSLPVGSTSRATPGPLALAYLRT